MIHLFFITCIHSCSKYRCVSNLPYLIWKWDENEMLKENKSMFIWCKIIKVIWIQTNKKSICVQTAFMKSHYLSMTRLVSVNDPNCWSERVPGWIQVPWLILWLMMVWWTFVKDNKWWGMRIEGWITIQNDCLGVFGAAANFALHKKPLQSPCSPSETNSSVWGLALVGF